MQTATPNATSETPRRKRRTPEPLHHVHRIGVASARESARSIRDQLDAAALAPWTDVVRSDLQAAGLL